MNNLELKFYNSAKNILEKNMNIWDEKKVLVYDLNSPLSKKVSEAFLENFKNISNSEVINFDEIEKEELKNKLLWLENGSTVILIQSTNFRLDNFRIRLNLHNAWIWCLELNHLSYIKDEEIENYADAIEYKTPYYDKVANWLEEKNNKAKSIKIESKNWDILEINWGFEKMKKNTWNYEWKKRWGSFPIWEVFTEALDFEKVNWEFTIYAFPDQKLQMEFCEPFKVKIKNSYLTCEKCPENFRKILDKIEEAEWWKVIMRELWFWLNTGISKEKPLSDVNAFERVAGFHISLWMKHNIYRNKFHKSLTQKYHIDVFPDIKKIIIDWEIVFENWKYLFFE